jgi:L-histidine N-alpha-methyltransferase
MGFRRRAPERPASLPHGPLPGHLRQPLAHARAAAIDQPTRLGERLVAIVSVRSQAGSTLAADVVAGLRATPRALPPKHFYDERGSQLFEAICETPEYYVTRTEATLLERIADDVIARVRPDALIELGSGSAKKTRILIDAMGRRHRDVRYVPVDISLVAVIESAAALLHEYSWLRVDAVVADYEQGMRRLPEVHGRRLLAFLGGTIGNFDVPGSVALLARLRERMRRGDGLLLGMDLVKSPAVLHAAYNDAAGVTAEFNRNMLAVINRRLRGDFDLGAFDHVAFYRPELEQIEMYLASRRAQRVTIRSLRLEVDFAAGEMIQTEISRKYTRASAAAIAAAAGLEVAAWYASPDAYFALALLVSRQ